MLQTVIAYNANDALHTGLRLLTACGCKLNSRNGTVLVAPGPVVTEYSRPDQRVLFSPLRDANPFFHLYESIWMLAGRNDAHSVARYAKTMESFANERGVLHGAYGFRWREQFGFDQLISIVDMLRADPNTRRAVLTMWSPEADLLNAAASKDVPCNTTVYFDATRGALDMTVCNRSNDIVWGAYGANFVHMSFMQEFVAASIGMRMGKYYQFSNNYHTYTDRPDVDRLLSKDGRDVVYAIDDRYANHLQLYSLPLGLNAQTFLQDCEDMAEDPISSHSTRHPFFTDVFCPMMRAHAEYKAGGDAYQQLTHCKADDWRIAGWEWLDRRLKAKP